MNARFAAGESALVIGLGRTGVAACEVLTARGVRVYATDEAPERVREAVASIERVGARFVAPAELNVVLPELTFAVLSPGVPQSSAVVRRARAAGVAVLGEIEVAYRLCAAPIIAVTGTKGKSTTTALIGHLLRAAGRAARVGGNIGNPLIREAAEARADEWVVAEVSSFQLETTYEFRPRVAVLLNVGEDHLDRYASVGEYAEAKYRIFANQSASDAFVGNLDDERLAALRGMTRVEEPSKTERAGAANDARSEAALRATQRIAARQSWFTLGERRAGAAMYLDGDRVIYAASGAPPVAVVSRGEIPLAGEHNVRNVMAASLAAIAAGATPESLRAGVRSFTPMAHRLQPVDEIDGVLYVDDSKATNPSAAIAALRAYERPVLLIAGGRAKGTAFDALGAEIDARAKRLVAIGEAADAIAATVRRTPVTRARSLEEAVVLARRASSPGDAVVLSPGCASFDMFGSAEERGERFAAAVRALREPAGA